MDITKTQSLLALMLTLDDVSTALNDQERRALAVVAEQLAANPAAWKTHIAANLEAALAASPQLKANFETYATRLAAFQDQLPANWLPQPRELEAVAPVPVGLVPKGFPPGLVDPDKDSEEINNIAIRILSTAKPEETVKKFEAFKRMKRELRQSLG